MISKVVFTIHCYNKHIHIIYIVEDIIQSNFFVCPKILSYYSSGYYAALNKL